MKPTLSDLDEARHDAALDYAVYGAYLCAHSDVGAPEPGPDWPNWPQAKAVLNRSDANEVLVNWVRDRLERAAPEGEDR